MCADRHPTHCSQLRSFYRSGLVLYSAIAICAAADSPPLAAQDSARSGPRSDTGVEEANYRQAGRFAPYKLQELIYSTSVTPQWIEGTERFWYEWETSDGKFFFLVDPVAGSKRELFDRDRIAAELTRITKDPWDAQHLPIREIKFLDTNTLQFEVESSQEDLEREVEYDEEEDREQWQEREEDRDRPRYEKIVFHFVYDVNTQSLRELEDWEAPDDHPEWASVSPDGEMVVFARSQNLFSMSGEDYRRILDARRGKKGRAAERAEDSIAVEEVQLTTDGEDHYSYAVFDRGDTDVEREKSKDMRKRTRVSWSKDSRRFALVRSDRRESGELWVIHSVGNDRPELETYKYDMPGEENVSQSEILIYDIESREMIEVRADAFEDQSLSVSSARQFIYPASDEPRRTLWLANNSDQLYFTRSSRDLRRIDVCVADANTGEVQVLIEERLNTYVEMQRLELLQSGDLLWWSERDGWAHIYRFGSDGTLRNRLTEGPWSVRQIVGIDEQRGLVYFLAGHVVLVSL
jgi:hypothetical protein